MENVNSILREFEKQQHFLYVEKYEKNISCIAHDLKTCKWCLERDKEILDDNIIEEIGNNSTIKTKIRRKPKFRSYNVVDVDKNGWVNSYYGRWNIKDDKPKLGVIYFMLDIHVEKIVEKQKIKFMKEMTEIISAANEKFKDMLEKHTKKVDLIYDSVKDIKEFMNKTIELNELKKPEVKKKEVKNSKSESEECLVKDN